jgi:hypothetical protein
MSVLKFSARAALVALALLVASAQAARAETITLVCSTGVSNDLGPSTIELNEGKGQVTITYSAVRALDGETFGGYTIGPFAAQFGEKTIFVPTHDDMNKTYTINRLTGTVDWEVTTGHGESHHGTWTCHKGEKQF